MPTTTLYSRSDTAATSVQSGTLPAAWQASWTVADEPTLSTVQKALSVSSGSGQQSTANNHPGSGGVGNQVTPPWYQLISGNVTPGSYASSTAWAVGIAFSPSNTLTGLDATGVVAVYLFKSNGVLRTTLQSGTVFGAVRNCTALSELTFYTAALSCAAFTASAGDYLVAEIGYQSTNNGSSSVTQNGTYYDCGTTAIASDGASISNAQSFISAPFALIAAPTNIPPDIHRDNTQRGNLRKPGGPEPYWSSWCRVPNLPFLRRRKSGLLVPA